MYIYYQSSPAALTLWTLTRQTENLYLHYSHRIISFPLEFREIVSLYTLHFLSYMQNFNFLISFVCALSVTYSVTGEYYCVWQYSPFIHVRLSKPTVADIGFPKRSPRRSVMRCLHYYLETTGTRDQSWHQGTSVPFKSTRRVLIKKIPPFPAYSGVGRVDLILRHSIPRPAVAQGHKV